MHFFSRGGRKIQGKKIRTDRSIFLPQIFLPKRGDSSQSLGRPLGTVPTGLGWRAAPEPYRLTSSLARSDFRYGKILVNQGQQLLDRVGLNGGRDGV